MKIELLDRNSVEIVRADLESLLDKFFDNESIMLDNKLRSFVPSLRFVESLCESQDELEEYKKVHILINKHHTLSSNGVREQVKNLKKLGEQRASETGNSWDQYYTAYDRRINRMRHQDLESLKKVFKPYLDETYELWQQEVKLFSSDAHNKLDNNKVADRKKLFKEVFKNNLLGFSYDKELSTSSRPVFSKELFDPWKLCFVIDNIQLNMSVEYGKTMTNGIEENFTDGGNALNRPGPKLDFDFGLIHKENRGASCKTPGKLSLFSFDFFFPIRIYKAAYIKFYNLEELEALYNIMLTLYSIMQDDFEKALYNGLKNCSMLQGH